MANLTKEEICMKNILLPVKKRKKRDTSTNIIVSASISENAKDILNKLSENLGISKSEIMELSILLFKKREDMITRNYNRIMSEVDNHLAIEETSNRRF